jgi:hypothetical protein
VCEWATEEVWAVWAVSLEARKAASIGFRGVRGSLSWVVVVVALCLVVLCLECGESLAEVPSIESLRLGATPFIQVEEFAPGTQHVSAEFYAELLDRVKSQPTTVTLQYVEAATYDPQAVDPYAAGVKVPLGTTSAGEPELHAHLVLEPGRVYHYRVRASNLEGSFETPDQTVETEPVSQVVLPDARAYEQVSPANKNNIDALGKGAGMTMQASPSKSTPAFAFFSIGPFPVAVGTAGLNTDYLSARSSSPEAWLTHGVQPPIEPLLDDADEAVGFTRDLARTIVDVDGPPLGLPGVTNAYVRDNETGTFQLLAPEISNAQPVLFVDASRDDSKILFETQRQLLPAAAAEDINLYEWDEAKPEGKRLTLAGVLPDAECAALSKPSGCAPANGSGAGVGGGEHQGTQKQDYLQDTISEDGARIFFTARPSGRIYEREPMAQPSAVTVPLSAGAATFLVATPSGKYVFYSEGGEMYRFDTSSETRERVTNGAEDVLGSLGISDDGAYAYFVASGVLAANEGAKAEIATKGAPNLYVWHEDTATHTAVITFIARLLSTEQEGDESDWWADNQTQTGEGKTSRVNPNGTALLFMSRASLTGYNNGRLTSSACKANKNLQVPCSELFLYNATGPPSSANPVCVSCNPISAVGRAQAQLDDGEVEVGIQGVQWSSHLTRNLSASGDRVFFETPESLVSNDVNGVGDVYEWEREGAGSCPEGEGHCLYLISTGTAHVRSFFGDADEEGENVFFFTRQSLVGQDRDLNYDVYDARVGGGIFAQSPPVEKNCGGEECKSPMFPAPVFASPQSMMLTGVGNPPSPPPPPKCTVNQKLKNGKCIPITCSRNQPSNSQCVVTKCPKGRRLSHGKCIKVKVRKRKKTSSGAPRAHRPRRGK